MRCSTKHESKRHRGNEKGDTCRQPVRQDLGQRNDSGRQTEQKEMIEASILQLCPEKAVQGQETRQKGTHPDDAGSQTVEQLWRGAERQWEKAATQNEEKHRGKRVGAVT